MSTYIPTPSTPPSAKLSLPAVSPFTPFDKTEDGRRDYDGTDVDSDSDASGSLHDALPNKSHDSLPGQLSELSLDISLASNDDRLTRPHTDTLRDMAGTTIIAPCSPLLSEQHSETDNNQSLFDMAVSPHLSMANPDMADNSPVPTEVSPMLIPALNNISIHPSSAVSSRYSVGTFGPSPESKSRARFSKPTVTDSEVGTTRSNSSRRRRPISMASAFDTHYEPSIGSSPPMMAWASTGRRPSATLEAEEDAEAAIQDLLMDLSRKNPSRIVPARRTSDAVVDEFGKMQAVTPPKARQSQHERQTSNAMAEPPSPIDPFAIPATPANRRHHPCSPLSPGESIQSHTSRRHNSLDSLNPSIADSLDGLLPLHGATAAEADFAYAFRGPRGHRKGKSAAVPQPLTIGPTRNELSPEQRAVLLRRTRKAEQVLGEHLCETDVERHIIEPVQTSRTIVTRVSDDHVGSDLAHVPEYERKDCELQVRSSQDHESQARAVRALAAFGFGEKQMPSDLRVYVQKEMRVAETSTSPIGISNRRGSDKSDMTYEEKVPLDERRHRRAQLAKLHKLLGVPVPTSVLYGTPSPVRTDSPAQVPTHEISFLDFGDEESVSWTQRVKSAMTGGKARATSPKIIMSTLRTSPPSSSRRDSDNTPARQRSTSEAGIATGDMHTHIQGEQEATYDAYASSLKSLMYLVEHDQASLANLMDTIENEAFPLHHPFRTSLVASPPVSPASGMSGSSSAPASPITSMHNIPRAAPRLSPSMMRARNDKLAKFFGEDVDFTSPPPNFHVNDLPYVNTGEESPRRPKFKHRQPTAERLRKRMDMFDGMLGEMWTAVQKDVKGGKMRTEERDRLGDMMGDLRRSSTLRCN